MRVILGLNRHSLLSWLSGIAIFASFFTGCANKHLGPVLVDASPSSVPTPVVHRTHIPIIQLTSTPIMIEPLFDPDLDIRAGPVDVPLEIHIPALNLQAPVIGVGLDSENKMDAPRGPIGDEIWQTAMWYRGSAIPGEPGTATFAGHVNDPLGLAGVFGHLRNLLPGDLIITKFTNTSEEIHFMVSENNVLKKSELSDPAIAAWIFGLEPAPDGLSHLVLITCTGYIINGQYDGFRIIYATRVN